MRTLISDIAKHAGDQVVICGHVKKLRDQKTMQFVILKDRTGAVQLTLPKTPDVSPLNKLVSQLSNESAIEVVGIVHQNDSVSLGGFEILLEKVEVLAPAEQPLPIDISEKSDTSLDKRMDWRFLDLRRQENFLVFQTQTVVEMAMREFWLSENFLEIHSPKLMGTPSESGAELFSLEYFGQTAYLAQSPQFYKQMAMAAGFDRVFEIGPVFRANPSFTSRHDTEFTSVDVEISWIKSHADVMALEEKWLQHILWRVKKDLGDKILSTFGINVTVPTLPFPKVPMNEAVRILREEMNYVPPPETKGDLDPQGERLLCKYFQEKTGHEFVFVTDYPVSVRPFYHMRYEEDPTKTKSFDLLWKGLEVTTGAQREHRYEILKKQALEKGLNTEPIQYYLDFFKYGCPPHGGYGFGLTRMLMILLNKSNVREVTYLYRGPNRLNP